MTHILFIGIELYSYILTFLPPSNFRKPFEGGDSGSVVYVKSGENRDAIAILKESRPKPQQHIYNAILLHQAIHEIQQDYPHLISDAQLYMPEKHLKLDQPPMSATSEDDSQYTPEQPVFV